MSDRCQDDEQPLPSVSLTVHHQPLLVHLVEVLELDVLALEGQLVEDLDVLGED